MMKVLYISRDARLDGAPKSLLEYITVIRDKGVEPIVMMPHMGPLQSELDKNGIKSRIIPYFPCAYTGKYGFVRYMKYIWINGKAIWKIKNFIRKEEINIVHTNTLAVNVGAAAAYIAKIPHIWHFREYLEEDFGCKTLQAGLTGILVRKSRYRIAVSEGIKKKYEKKYEKKYGVHTIRLYDGVERVQYECAVHEEHNGENTAELLLAGTICKGKGQWDAIRAVAILVQRGIFVHLNIIGNGEPVFIKELKNYVRKNGLGRYISFRSYTKNLQKIRVQSKIVLVCSKMEAFGRVTVEAMLAGKIVIGTNTGGTQELIGKNEERGYLYQYGNPEELADKIQYVLDNEEEILEKEIRAQNFIIKLTDIENYTDKMIQIYKKASQKYCKNEV